MAIFRHTKIGATLGPASSNRETIAELVEAGIDFARLNFSHGTLTSHESILSNLRSVCLKHNRPVAVMADLPGPKIRLGILPPAGVMVNTGEIIAFNTESVDYNNNEIPVDQPLMTNFVKPGEKILIDDGRLEVKVVKIEASKIFAEVVEGGQLLTNKGINLPDSDLPLTILTEKNKEHLQSAVRLGLDLVAVSFVKSAQDVLDVRFAITQFEKELNLVNQNPIAIIAKIERYQAVKNIEEILAVADGIMVARGDLGLEMPAEEVPLVQKKIIDLCNAAAKPVIVATQMLDSMQESRRPSRAEVSDVANAVIDHADALMLANETATGKYPVLAVATMSKIIMTTEKSVYDDTNLPVMHHSGTSVDVAITEMSRILAGEVKAKLILAASLSGETGRLISHVRPNLPILVATSSERVWHQLNLSWGVCPFVLPAAHSVEELVERSVAYIKTNKVAKMGDRMIIVAGEPVGQAGNVNLVEVREIK